MTNLYIENAGISGQRGVWKVNNSDYQFIYAAFTPGEDVNLDMVSIRTQVAGGTTVSTKFQAGLYSAGTNSSAPGSLISYLSGPEEPTAGAYNDYRPTSTLGLSSGNQYWLGFTLSDNDGVNSGTRVRLGTNTGNFTTLGAGWSAQSSIHVITDGIAEIPNPNTPLVYRLYATPVCFASGTLIMMANGHEKPIEEMNIGEIVMTSRGPLALKWIAKRTFWKQRASGGCYKKALPVRIQAGSLGDGIPRNDLLVSSCHGIWVDGRVVNASFLENGVNIARVAEEEFAHCIQYYHLEFDKEVLVEANGALACSYVNLNNRRSFDNFPEFISRYCSVDMTASSVIRSGPRNRPSLEGHKERVKRAWISSSCTSDTRAHDQAVTAQLVTI